MDGIGDLYTFCCELKDRDSSTTNELDAFNRIIADFISRETKAFMRRTHPDGTFSYIRMFNSSFHLEIVDALKQLKAHCEEVEKEMLQ